MTQKLKATFCQFTVEAGRVINRAHLLEQDVRYSVDTINSAATVFLYNFEGEEMQAVSLGDFQCLEKLIAMKKSLCYDTGTAYVNKPDDEFIDELLESASK